MTDNDPDQAAQAAEMLGQKFFSLRHEMDQMPYSIDEALDQALALDHHPVVIADRADNVWDPIVVQVAMSGGVGATLDLRLGGKMGPASGDPLDLTVTVTGVVQNMIQEWPQQGEPLLMPCGDAVSLHCNGIDIIVNSKRGQVFSPQVFSNLGVDPLQKQILVVKSSQHFYAGFAPIASEIIYMAAPGAVAPRYTEIPYQHVDRNKYPWVDDPFA